MDNENLCGWTAICLSSCFYFSLVVPFFSVLRCKKNYEFTPIGLIDMIYIDSIAWYIYGDRIVCEKIKLGNCIGAGACLTLIVIYLAFELKKFLVDTILNCLILVLGTLVMHKGLTIVIEDTMVLGKICVGTRIITFCTPIFMIYRVIKEKNYMHISLFTTITYLLACTGWAFYGKNTNDYNVMCANCAGAVLGLIQLCVYFNYKKKYGLLSGPTSTIGIESGLSEETRKDDSTTITIDEESQQKAKEKPVKIVAKTDN